jgi:hypothetical protein|tara:strand:+ start:228 stop:443 length:216 start_codon:yes stop_codon:yes gene_type:complete
MTFKEWYKRIEFSITWDCSPWLDKEYILEMLEMDEDWKNTSDSNKIKFFKIMIIDEFEDSIKNICELAKEK